MDEPVVLARERGAILVLTLNRPEVMNAFNFAQLHALGGHIESVRFRPEIRVIVITGAGEKAFCAGADLKERATMGEVQVKEFLFTIGALFSAIESLGKPVIAAINGVALGGGLELALAADIRMAAQEASLGLTETRLAIIPGAGGTQRLPRLVGMAKAKELIFTGRRIDAAEAHAMGLVNHVFPKARLLDECQKMANMICGNGPVAVEQAKYAIHHGSQTDLQTGLAIESKSYWVTIPTHDRQEGLAAFREKRKPRYRGN